MASSTSHHGSLNTRLLGWLLLGVLGAPMLWLITEEAGYALAYQACDTRSNSWVLVPTAAAIAITAGITLISARAHRRASTERIPLPFVGWIALGMAALMVLVLVASAVAPLILHPCD